MRGDFSRWRDERRFNFNGVLHQQGRVLLDGDWNAQTNLTNDWQDTSGRDAFGAFVAAVPAEVPDSFKIKSATFTGTEVRVTIAPGRVWADGLLARLEGPGDVTRVATYLEPPVAPVPAAPVGGDRDAVVLELWREEMNGFQMPDDLIEPALGGPDTTERVHTAMALRLFRMTDPDDTCESIVDDLQDDFGAKGKLTVTLDAPSIVAGDCPVTDEGGYTGFEHNLYRVEIARVNAGVAPMFKWSQFGGGLVGRGKFAVSGATATLTIDANDQAIINSGLPEFYMEAYEFSPPTAAGVGLGHWRVVYGATVTLNSATGVLSVPVPGAAGHFFGAAVPTPANTSFFFRLWNGIEPIAQFDELNPVELNDGIELQFEPAAGANYAPGDYWTFDVRAGDIGNRTPLVDKEPPEGIHYHRVPLGVLTWPTQGNTPEIEDCRRPFQPLTKLSHCCTYRVGDGRSSHGDFTSIQAAVDALPASGGKVCVLPGRYEENVRIRARRNVTIEGCGRRTLVVSREPAGGAQAAPVFHVIESQHIKILSLAIEAHPRGIGVLLEGRLLQALLRDELVRAAASRLGPVLHVTLEELYIRAAARSAIHAEVCFFTTVRRCRIEMRDVRTSRPAVFFIGDDGLIEDNYIAVPNESAREGLAGFADQVQQLDATLSGRASVGLGGLQLGGGCERVRVTGNLIARGAGIGIRLGHIITETIDGQPPPDDEPETPDDPCDNCEPGDNSVPDPRPDDRVRRRAGPPLRDIEIVGNRVYNMGLDGIGVAGFFNLARLDEFVTVDGLLIVSNEIRFCLNRALADIREDMRKSMGYGGIALADVSDLVVRDNFITDNGPDFREPVCGVFVLHGEGVEISRNHILNNGAKPPGARDQGAAVKRGPRGGIHVVYAVAPLVPLNLIGDTIVPVHGGFPALKVHDNVVGVPVGRSLSAAAVGPVSVVGNQFTTRGIPVGDFETFVASTVFIMNLGLSNELHLQLITFVALLTQGVRTPGTVQPGLDDAGVGRFLLGGNVLLKANQFALDLFDMEVSFAMTSVAVFTLDDVGFHDNQSDCNLFGDRLLFNVGLLGVSVRMSDNRLKESVGQQIENRPQLTVNNPVAQRFSAVTIGLFNTTTDNQSTFCLLIQGLPNLTVDHSNKSLVMIVNRTACCRFLIHQSDCFRQDVPV